MTSNRHHRECEECGALLGDRDKHTRWHEALKREVDNAAELGNRALKRVDDNERTLREAFRS